MPAHLTVDGISCDPEVVTLPYSGSLMPSIKVINDGDETVEATLVVHVYDPAGTEIFSDQAAQTLNPTEWCVHGFPVDPDRLSQSGTYTATLGVEGAGQSQSGGSCTFTVG
jgi:hypothetical protein